MQIAAVADREICLAATKRHRGIDGVSHVWIDPENAFLLKIKPL